LRNPLHRLPPFWHTLADWTLTVAAVAAFVLIFEAEVAKPYRIPSSSMEPTLHCARPAQGCRAAHSDRVIADRLVYRFHAPRRGDIVVFDAPAAASVRCSGAGGAFVKRIVGLPGEAVSERDGFVYVNGRRLSEPYVRSWERDSLTQAWPRVPRDSYFVMGDNRVDSCDSRAWGPVPRSRIVGRVDLTYWPPSRIDVG
jgi:signal peptidase I